MSIVCSSTLRAPRHAVELERALRCLAPSARSIENTASSARERRAVVEAHVRAQLEAPGLRRRAACHETRERRLERESLVAVDQRFVDLERRPASGRAAPARAGPSSADRSRWRCAGPRARRGAERATAQASARKALRGEPTSRVASPCSDDLEVALQFPVGDARPATGATPTRASPRSGRRSRRRASRARSRDSLKMRVVSISVRGARGTSSAPWLVPGDRRRRELEPLLDAVQAGGDAPPPSRGRG